MTQNLVELKHKRETLNWQGIEVDKGFTLSPAWVEENRKVIEEWIDYFISYPDIFLDIIKPPSTAIDLYFYQRLLLRACVRFRYVFGTFTRGYSKSFIAILSRILVCIFFPYTKSFVCTDVKSTGIKIVREKIDEIFQFWPFLRSEVSRIYQSNDYIELWFHNGSMFDIIGTSQGTRGIRRNNGFLDEAALFDPEELNERVLPTMNISRKDVLGRMDHNENTNQQQIWMTTAASKTNFAYDKLLEFAVISILSPESAYICGGDYRLPVKVGLMGKRQLEEMRLSSTFRADSFAREMMSIWSGGSNDSWVNMDKLLKMRRNLLPEYAAVNSKVAKGDFYIISVDVARTGANTVIHVFRVSERSNYFQKYLVYTETLHDQHFNVQANRIKHLNNLYLPREVVVDGNGPGIGLIDLLVMDTFDSEKGVVYEALGVINDQDYIKRQDPDIKRVVYVLKTGGPSAASLIHSNCFVQLSSNRVTFLAADQVARSRLLSTKKGQKMSTKERVIALMPFEMTSRLFDELGNIRVKQLVDRIDIELISRRLNKDRFSALEYGLWRIKEYEDQWIKERNRGKNRLTDYLFISPKGKKKTPSFRR